jgi:hypothetical protein
MASGYTGKNLSTTGHVVVNTGVFAIMWCRFMFTCYFNLISMTAANPAVGVGFGIEGSIFLYNAK